VPLLAVYREKDTKTKGNLIRFVFPFCDMGDLNVFLAKLKKRSQSWEETGLTIEQVIDFAEQIVKALQIIHDKQLMHRDLKPSNILLTASTVDTGVGQARTS
jgi:serine/threonine protein kinase